MVVVWTILIGFIVGLVARFIKPGDDSMGFFMTSLLGIAGAFVGALLSQTFYATAPGEPVGFLASLIGAVIILFAIELVRGNRQAPRKF